MRLTQGDRSGGVHRLALRRDAEGVRGMVAKRLPVLLVALALAGCGAGGQGAGSFTPAESLIADPSIVSATAQPTRSPDLPTPSPELVVCEYYSSMELDSSLSENPPGEDAPNTLITKVFVIETLGTPGNSVLLLRQAIDKLEDMAARADSEEGEDLSALAQRLDDMALSGDTTSLGEVAGAFRTKYADECGASTSS